MPRRKPLDQVKDRVPGLAERPESVARGKRDRRWDEANRAFSFRIREADAERLAEQAAALGLSRDALARALMEAALDALARGWLALDIETATTETVDRLGRQRIATRRIAHPAWTLERNDSSGE